MRFGDCVWCEPVGGRVRLAHCLCCAPQGINSNEADPVLVLEFCIPPPAMSCSAEMSTFSSPDFLASSCTSC